MEQFSKLFVGDHAACFDVRQTDMDVAEEIDLVEKALVALDVYDDRNVLAFMP